MNRISARTSGRLLPDPPRVFKDVVFFSDDPAAVVHAPGRAEALEEARRFHPTAAADGEMAAAPTPPGLWPPPELVAALDPLALD